MDLEEHSLDPVIERTCAECGAQLTPDEIEAAMEAGGPYLCGRSAWRPSGEANPLVCAYPR